MTKDHRRFLRKPRFTALQLGDAIANLQFGEEPNSRRLHDYVEDYLLLFVLSTQCEFCVQALEAISQFIEENPSVEPLLLIDGDDAEIEFIQSQLVHAKIERTTTRILTEQLNAPFYPWVYGINKNKEVVTSYNCNIREINEAYRPFRAFVKG